MHGFDLAGQTAPLLCGVSDTWQKPADDAIGVGHRHLSDQMVAPQISANFNRGLDVDCIGNCFPSLSDVLLDTCQLEVVHVNCQNNTEGLVGKNSGPTRDRSGTSLDELFFTVFLTKRSRIGVAVKGKF